MNDRSARKQYLIAESELSRSRLLEECLSLTTSFHRLGERAGTFKSVASSAALLVTGLAAFKGSGEKLNRPAGKRAWIPNLLKVAGLASTVWLALQSQKRDHV